MALEPQRVACPAQLLLPRQVVHVANHVQQLLPKGSQREAGRAGRHRRLKPFSVELPSHKRVHEVSQVHRALHLPPPLLERALLVGHLVVCAHGRGELQGPHQRLKLVGAKHHGEKRRRVHQVALLHVLLPPLVVLLPELRVGQHLVGRAHFLKLGRRGRVPRVLVRVARARDFVVRLLDFGGRRFRRQTQHVVVFAVLYRLLRRCPARAALPVALAVCLFRELGLHVHFQHPRRLGPQVVGHVALLVLVPLQVVLLRLDGFRGVGRAAYHLRRAVDCPRDGEHHGPNEAEAESRAKPFRPAFPSARDGRRHQRRGPRSHARPHGFDHAPCALPKVPRPFTVPKQGPEPWAIVFVDLATGVPRFVCPFGGCFTATIISSRHRNSDCESEKK
mmetsp:Transcript_69380/g.130472  ORF Transcript_69380/g.130472 Transcript_69380/m.130472 type:complete len:391 (-) Transcript_69380:103-1275(-)